MFIHFKLKQISIKRKLWYRVRINKRTGGKILENKYIPKCTRFNNLGKTEEKLSKKK